MMKLGKKPHFVHPATLQLVKYLIPTALPPAPASYAIPSQPTFPMFLNDSIGDCTCAAAAHMIEAWSAATGLVTAIDDGMVLGVYEAVSGYNPTDGSNDNGAVELDVLRFWRKHGIANNKIGAFALVDPHVPALVRDACYLFGGLYIGIALPASAQDQLDAGQQWHTAGSMTGKYAPGSWGGHAVNIVAYDRYGLTCITWGKPQRMTWGFWRAYVDEAWAVLDTSWFDKSKKTPAGIDIPTLQTDLTKVGKIAA